MGYNTTGSSNAASKGSKLALDIRISPDDIDADILLAGEFRISNLASLITGNDLVTLRCALYGKPRDNSRLPKDAQPFKLLSTGTLHICDIPAKAAEPGTCSKVFPRTYKDSYSYLLISIRAENCDIQQPVEELKIIFFDKYNANDQQQPGKNEIRFEVQNWQAPPVIESFDLSKSVLQANIERAAFTWNLSGEAYEYVLREGQNELYRQTGEGQKRDEFLLDPVSTGDHVYTLEVKQGPTVVTRTQIIRGLGESKLLLLANPVLPARVGNFCISENSDCIFSLMLHLEGQSGAVLADIGINKEGFSNNWSYIRLTKGDRERLKPFASSPMLHLKDPGEIYGRLVFIGGSFVKPKDCSNEVAIVYLDKDLGPAADDNPGSVMVSRVEVAGNMPWQPRMGHSCVIFPHDDNPGKIWMMGGVDEFGNALNEVWVSVDGLGWDSIDATGKKANVEDQRIPWAGRCLAGSSVELGKDGTKKAIWIGGGYAEVGGRETADIWKWDKSSWSNIAPLKIHSGSYLSSGLAFIGPEKIQSSGMCVFGGYTKQEGDNLNVYPFFNNINRDNNGYTYSGDNNWFVGNVFDTSKNAYVLTCYFKGCLWFMVFTNEGQVGITYSQLCNWVPVITSFTLLLS